MWLHVSDTITSYKSLLNMNKITLVAITIVHALQPTKPKSSSKANIIIIKIQTDHLSQ